MTNSFIPMEQLAHRRIYALKARNLALGVWNEDNQSFMGIQHTGGGIYLFSEYHWDVLSSGTAQALEIVDERLPDGIVLAENLGTECSGHRRPMNFTSPIATGGDGWIHTDDNSRCNEGYPFSLTNKALYEFLAPLDETIRSTRHGH